MSYLDDAEERLQRIEQLLLRPLPGAIRQAEHLLMEAATLVSDCSRQISETPAGASDLRPSIERFRVRCERLTKLLEGARRAQWIRLRLITCLTQTYNARAEAKMCPPRSGTINIRM